MGIERIEAYVCTCDNCGMNYESDDFYRVFADKAEADDNCRNYGNWARDGDKYYCDECYEFDEHGNVSIKPIKQN